MLGLDFGSVETGEHKIDYSEAVDMKLVEDCLASSHTIFFLLLHGDSLRYPIPLCKKCLVDLRVGCYDSHFCSY